MNTLSRARIAALLVLCGAAAQAADAPAPPAAPATEPAGREVKEPVVQRTVIDDGRAVIEELRVRGQLVKATVHPKDGSPSYEIIVGDGSRDLSEGRNNSRGAAGKRVWNVLTF
ncbi:MAG: DUF2782 domain-containing protein [Burkholderiales bacterium]|nr:DUF2782 domain-containing protein [Burkholderiales bacterium]